MASKRFKRFKSSNAEVGVGTKEIDVISQLEGIPHVLEQILLHLDAAMLLDAAKVSTTWKRLINSTCSPALWKCAWKNSLRMSLTWKALSARMEHLETQLWDRMKEGDSASYQEACRYVQGNIRQVSHSAMKSFNFHVLRSNHYWGPRIRMNEKYLFIGGCGVDIFNRWTRELVKKLVGYVARVSYMQLNERFLVVQFGDRIHVYDAQMLVLIQTIEVSAVKVNSFGLGSHALVTCEHSRNWKHWLLYVHRWNPSTAQFVRDTQTDDWLKVDRTISFFSPYIYVDEKYINFG